MSNRAMAVVGGAVAGIVGIGVLVQVELLGRPDADTAIDLLVAAGTGVIGYAVGRVTGRGAQPADL